MDPRIHEIKEKIKSHGADIFLVCASILLCVLGVGLWRLYSMKPAVFSPQYQHEAFPVPTTEGGRGIMPIVASKAGTKYYPVGCKSASRIKDENKIYFASALDAEKAGFQSSGVCQ